MTEHTHSMDGQSLVHTHGPDEVRSDQTMANHGYFGHIEDRPGEPIGAIERVEPENFGTVPLDTNTSAWAKGVAKGSDLQDMLAGMTEDEAPKTFEHRVAWYWLYVGTGAAEAGITSDTVMQYVAGASLRAPQRHQQFTLEFSTEELIDPNDESEDHVSLQLAAQLRSVLDSIREMSAFDDEGPVYNLKKQVGTWRLYL